ncbi:Fic family protein [Olsenella uli]|uniref:Fic family protein n=1 Tax=Olsenella uli TaxID=133926 RepID=UPI001959B12A|nr:Fic family protein [Olsenella uli]MBM6676064.1 Fic family protein [Olsenella uli]
MGAYETAYWLTDTWGMSRREPRSGAYHPYRPDLIGGFAPSFSAAAVASISRAESAIRALNETSSHLTDTEPLARLIMRAEALASSRIEGLEMPAGRLLEFEALDELGVPHRVDGAEAAVIGNIAAMQRGVERAASSSKLTVDLLCDINAALLEGTGAAGYAGVLRTEQNWVGGNRVNPLGAAYVPPRPELVPGLVDDLVLFCNSSELPSVAVAAIAHAQFETIHPFADGNGRTGRALVHIILRRTGLAPRVVPPVSLVLATDRERYIDNLAAYRADSAADEASADEAASDWVEYFSNACVVACERAAFFEASVGRIQDRWRERVRPRGNSAADLLLSALPSSPVISIESGARLTGRSREAVRQAVATLVDAGVLYQSAKNRKSNIYAARDILDAFTAYERALAVPGGDTAVEKSARHVPQRPAHRR